MSDLKIVQVKQLAIYMVSIETEFHRQFGCDPSRYRRVQADVWEQRYGESWEAAYGEEKEELEAAFQEWLKDNEE